ncbi:hypothetical protein KY312_03800 [Candidatus Woesearchaeota archaeon]|nr:hypothetical protein [Candidatus Woesearchaeota archaeon]
MNKKAQAATEFLMTYGWAILVVGVAIAALAYFGVLSPSRFLPNKCTFPSGVACIDYKVDASTVTMILQNSLGYTINVTDVNLTDAGCANTSINVQMQNGDTGTFTISCTNIVGEKFKSDVRMDFLRIDTGLTQTFEGELLGQVQ